MIEVTNLTKKYGTHIAVDHLSFRVEKGQVYGFLGPNGAGKSTTMNIITGYIAPSEGTVTIDGRDIQKEPEEAKKRIGYLPEMPPLYMEMTVEEYLMFAAQLKKVPKAERKAQMEYVMEMTQTADVRGRLIRNLSKGYRQRVGLAQAILGDPEVIILDEPSVGLDPKQIIEIRDLIRRLGENHTIILSSHILSEVSAVCDHIMIISQGHLIASDSPEGLKKRMSASMELQLAVKGERERLGAVLDTIPDIASWEWTDTDKSGCTEVRAVFQENADAREDIFYALAEAKLPVLKMIPSEKSLEEIFLQLTEETAVPEGKHRKIFAGRKADQGHAADRSAKQKAAADRSTEQEETADRSAKQKETADRNAKQEKVAGRNTEGAEPADTKAAWEETAGRSAEQKEITGMNENAGTKKEGGASDDGSL